MGRYSRRSPASHESQELKVPLELIEISSSILLNERVRRDTTELPSEEMNYATKRQDTRRKTLNQTSVSTGRGLVIALSRARFQGH